MTKPPNSLWNRTGDYPDGSTASMEVKICRDPSGYVWSVHKPMSDEDELIFRSWPGFGTRAIAHALLVESTRREMYMCLLAEVTRNNGLIGEYKGGDQATRKLIEEHVSKVAEDNINAVVTKISNEVAKEILDMLLRQGLNGGQNA